MFICHKIPLSGLPVQRPSFIFVVCSGAPESFESLRTREGAGFARHERPPRPLGGRPSDPRPPRSPDSIYSFNHIEVLICLHILGQASFNPTWTFSVPPELGSNPPSIADGPNCMCVLLGLLKLNVVVKHLTA